MHFSGTAFPWRGCCRRPRLSWHAALLLTSLRLAAAVESYKPPESISDTSRCQASQDHPAGDACVDAARASREAAPQVLIQRSASLASPYKQNGNSIKDVLELARVSAPKEVQDPDDSEVENADAEVENDPAGEDSRRRRRKMGESSLDTSSETRPNSGTKKSDTVEFGVYLKEFHRVNFADDTFSCDLVLTLRWTDKRARKVLKGDEKSVTMPTALAKKNIWLPDVAVTNRALKGFDTISSTVTVSDSGQVTKTERMYVIVLAAFDVKSFPFDDQMLNIRVASSSYMANEVQLSVIRETEQDPQASGLNEGIFSTSGFSLNSVKASSFEETDGSLTKSRGTLDISITRNYMPLVFSCLVPNLLLLFISWSVFFFPMQPPFVMPRVATSLISLLSSMTLAVRTSRLLPDKRSGYVWIEFYEETCQTMMFVTVCLNILVELVFHEWKLVPLATTMSDELRRGYGCLICLMAIFWVWGYIRRDATSLQFGPLWGTEANGLSPVVFIVRVILFLGLLCYVAYSLARVSTAAKQVTKEKSREHLDAVPVRTYDTTPHYVTTMVPASMPVYSDVPAGIPVYSDMPRGLVYQSQA